MRPCAAFAALLACFAGTTPSAHAQATGRNVTFRFVPTARAQIAIWLESSDGARFATVRLTDAVSRRGVGNRPGAGQMNSGYHWPYGRREGVLPVWAHRRAAAPGAMLFTRVIFQDRPEGFADRIVDDSTIDPYSCLSFMVETTRRDGLDAVSCASPNAFYGDKGRFITSTDVAKGYAEPSDLGRRTLDLTSLYPPRSDVAGCSGGGCLDSLDVSQYAGDARRVLPDLDTITMATPPADQPIAIAFDIPAAWPDGDYLAYLEINTEGDYNLSYNDTLYPTPKGSDWDVWAISYGYPFRGQPSVVFRLEIHVPASDQTWSTDVAHGYGSLSGVGAQGGAITPIDSTISNDYLNAPGSGVDRLRFAAEGYRLRVDVGPSPPDAGTNPDGASDAGADAGDAGAGNDAGDSGRPPPLCIPGMTVACACVGGGQGAQTCGSDGNHFEACECPDTHLSPRNGGCGCDCDVGGGAGGPLAIVLLALTLVARRRKHG